MNFEDKIVEILQAQFQPQKKHSCFLRKPKPVTPHPIGFSEFQLWLHQNKCQELLEDNEFMQSMLAPSGSSSQDDYLSLFAQYIIEQEKNHQATSQKAQKIQSLLSNIQRFCQDLNGASNKQEEAESVQFNVYIDKVVGNGLKTEKGENVSTYFLEFGYKEDSVLSNKKKIEGGLIHFEGEQVSFSFSNKEGSIFIHLCEKVVQGGKAYKKVIARGSLDVFGHAKLASTQNEISRLLKNGDYDSVLLKRAEEDAHYKMSRSAEDDIIEIKLLVVPQNDSVDDDLDTYYSKIMKWRQNYLEQILKAFKRKMEQIEKRLNSMVALCGEKLFFNGTNLVLESNNDTLDTLNQSQHLLLA